MTTLLSTTVNGTTIELFENLKNHNIGGRSIYSIRKTSESGTSIKDLGNDKEKAFMVAMVDTVDLMVAVRTPHFTKGEN